MNTRSKANIKDEKKSTPQKSKVGGFSKTKTDQKKKESKEKFSRKAGSVSANETKVYFPVYIIGNIKNGKTQWELNDPIKPYASYEDAFSDLKNMMMEDMALTFENVEDTTIPMIVKDFASGKNVNWDDMIQAWKKYKVLHNFHLKVGVFSM